MQPYWNGEERRHSCLGNAVVDCPHLEDAAERAVAKVFAILGVDINRPESVEEFREDLRFGKRLRRVLNHGILAFFGVVATAIAAALWTGIVTYIKH